ncbi:MAG TPA: hypothetical protein DCS63_03550 [Elusimicrobia bacterium]|nr:hypothetical protein [Elusimicrobiota bacterium]
MIKKITEWFDIEKNFLLAWLGLALLLRLAFVIKTGSGGISPDAGDWMNTAWSVATGQGFGGSWRPPGYVFYLAGVFLVFGKSVIAVKLLNALLGTATALLAYHTAKLLFSQRTARITAALISFYPYFIAYTGDALSETFLTFMLAAAVYLIARTASKPSWGNIAVTGIFIGLTGLTKSTTLPFFMLACAWLWWRAGLRAGFMVGVFTLLTIAPWTLRNYFHYDKSYIMPVSTPWYSLYGASCDEALWPETLPELDTPPTDELNALAIPKDWGYVASLPLPERDKYCKEKALAWLKANPEKFRLLVYKRFLHFWRLYPMMAWRWQKHLAMATSGIYIPLCVIGLALAWRKFRGTSLIIALFAAYTAVHLFFVVTLRYRVPMDTFVIMMAALALDEALSRLKPGRAERAPL